MDLLPIHEVLEELKNQLKTNQIVILEAEPGAGKTTVIPLSLLEEDWLVGKKILVLEPRRLATRNAAYRMSQNLNEEVGNTVGYQIRFESKVSSNTRIEVVTEGIFTRRIQADPELKNIGLVIFDEFHERNLQTDIGLAFALEAQSVFREDLKILVMSATIDSSSIANFLNASVVISKGRTYLVEIRYLTHFNEKLENRILSAIRKALLDKGDILVFLPGSGEIRRVQKEIEENLNLSNILVCPLYGDLPQKDQDLAIYPDKIGRRKIILSTNIAESSLTIEGVGIVIDSGLCRIPRFEPSSGMTKLVTTSIAKDSMNQRTGRAGRLGPGISYRIWSKEEEKNYLEKTKPEILETDLTQFLLDVSSWGTQLSELKFLDRPHDSSIQRASKLLKDLGLFDKNGKITEIGLLVAKLPLHPRLGYMIISSSKLGLLYIASILSAILNEKNLFSVGHFSYKQVDLGLQVEEFLKNQHSFVAKKIKLSSEEIFKIGMNGKIENSKFIDINKLGIVLSFAYPDRIGKLREKNGRRYKLTSGKGAILRDNDSLAGNEFIVIADLDGDNKESNIYSAAKITLPEILEFHKEKIISRRTISMDEKSGKISVLQETALGELVLNSKEIQDAVTFELLQDHWINFIRKNGLSVLPWTEEVEQFRRRSELLRLLGEKLPSVEDEYLIENLEKWLLPYLDNIRRISDFKKIDLTSIIKSSYSYEQIQLLEREAPERWEVPSGSKIKLDYKKDEILLSVKIQELFGLMETPKIARGKVTLTLQLLSPSQRPIQITKDLVGFWDRTYIEVKKELAGRYPRHPWPDNPRLAVATKYTKKKVY
ncbi:MAG: ATP-dependent helicase HrpB [Leptospiraceae bacterium]|nr:ATP-dependent helicase HrpB [Leptospiraceae bacterium]